jgi:hypothetical protein
MNSRQRVEAVLQWKVPDRIPADLGGTSVTGMHVILRDGGYIFNAIHNIQAGVPVENLLASFQAYRENHNYC